MKIRLYCWWSGSQNVLEDIVSRLSDENVLEKCICELHEGIAENTEKITYIETKSYGRECYAGCESLEKMAPLSETIIKSMLPYESMAIRLGIRRTNIPAFEYERERYRYMRALRFWNHILDSHKINMCFFKNVPHFQGAYIVYALAKIKGISVKMLCDTCFVPYRTVGDNIENIGANITHIYEKMKNVNCELDDDLIGKYYRIHVGELEDIKKEYNPGKDRYTNEMLKKNKKQYMVRYGGMTNRIKPYYLWMRSVMAVFMKYHDITHYKNTAEMIDRMKEEQRMANFFKKRYMMTIREYNRRAEMLIGGGLRNIYILRCSMCQK